MLSHFNDWLAQTHEEILPMVQSFVSKHIVWGRVGSCGVLVGKIVTKSSVVAI
jgi:hypothetical protein